MGACGGGGGGSRDSTVRVLISHKCDPGSNPGPGLISGLLLALRGFFNQVL